jgi:hypothetical protein
MPLKGYEISLVPSDAEVTFFNCNRRIPDEHFAPPESSDLPNLGISSNHNVVAALVAIAQTVNAGFTLVAARGRQLDDYGFAAFGLTVTPYLVMSIFNLCAQIVTPDYPMLYMVHSPEMEEACKRKRKDDQGEDLGDVLFDGVIGTIVTEAEADVYRVKRKDDHGFTLEPGRSSNYYSSFVPSLENENIVVRYRSRDNEFPLVIPSCVPFRRELAKKVGKTRWLELLLITTVAPIGVGLISLIVMGGISRFQIGNSTLLQRTWTMSWLIVGMASGLSAVFLSWASGELGRFSSRRSRRGCLDWFMILGMFLLLSLLSAPAIGGFVTVGSMLKETGICEKVG